MFDISYLYMTFLSLDVSDAILIVHKIYYIIEITNKNHYNRNKRKVKLNSACVLILNSVPLLHKIH